MTGKTMKPNIMFMILNGLALIFLVATFLLQYEHLWITRIVLIVFTIIYSVIEIKKEYFSSNKLIVIIFSATSITLLIVSIFLDTANSMTNDRVYFIPVYVFILIVLMYKDLFDKEKTEKS